ncbi:PREDICTED: translation initiation factor IF-2-like [Myotis brandtii]|uniref:translation initiation factor IF-2-like n=1 Tax=Myotis brandtii TaxID=109478 RepID=UPI0007040ABA|nr:PREDICTED: translation initiation factor IF-2-like [Myotis brandtii]XP_014388596.1 PREDICTED: translation initiation factor IF-2-like [Myotis brandtii]
MGADGTDLGLRLESATGSKSPAPWENSAPETPRRSGDISRSLSPGFTPDPPGAGQGRRRPGRWGTRDSWGQRDPAPRPSCLSSWSCWPFVWAVACLASGASWQPWQQRAQQRAQQWAQQRAQQRTQQGPARPAPAWVPGRVRTCSGSVWSFFPGTGQRSPRCPGAPGGPGTAGCGPRVSGACPTATGQGARPTLQREPRSQQEVSREKGAYFEELTRAIRWGGWPGREGVAVCVWRPTAGTPSPPGSSVCSSAPAFSWRARPTHTQKTTCVSQSPGRRLVSPRNTRTETPRGMSDQVSAVWPHQVDRQNRPPGSGM